MPEIAEIIFWAVAVGATITVMGPVLLSLLGCTRLRFVAEEDPALVAPADDDPDYLQVYQELQALGFRPLGVVHEKIYFDQLHWFRQSDVSCLGSEDGQHFVSLYRLDPIEPVRLSFETLTTEGAMVRTLLPGAGLEPLETDRYSRVEHQRLAVAEVFTRHLQQVEDFVKHHGGAVARVSLAVRAELDAELELELYREIVGYGVYIIPILFFLLPAYAAYRLILMAGMSAAQALPAALVIACLLYLWITGVSMRAMFREEVLRSHDPAQAEEHED